tara:strand:+ start:300 stop:638 length:339 start_codon:yes stop_codon:yes gene_type:complete
MSKKIDIIKDLKKMGLVPRNKHYNQMIRLSKWSFIVGFAILIIVSMSGCSTMRVIENDKVLEEIVRVYDEDDVVRDIELKIKSIDTQGIEVADKICYSKRMGVHFCPDGRTY